MVKKANKLMTILSVLTVAFVGVNSVETVATNVNAYETSIMHYLTIKWETDRLMFKSDGGTFQDDFAVHLDNKTAIYGSKDVYINLKGTYDLYFADHHNKQYHNYVFGDIYADAIIINEHVIQFLLNGESSGNFDYIDITTNLNGSENAYIFRQGESSEYQQGYSDGYDRDAYNDGYNDGNDDGYDTGYYHGEQDGYDLGYEDGYEDGYDYGEFYGYNMGRHEFGIFFEGEWRKAEWFGYFSYNEGYNDGLIEKDLFGFGGLLTAVFGGLGSLLSVQLFPGVYLGAIVAVPLVFGIIFFILGKRKGD